MAGALRARRRVPSSLLARVTEGHRDDRNRCLIVKLLRGHAHPFAQLPTGLVIKRNAGLMNLCPWSLACDQQSRTCRGLEDRTWPQRQEVCTHAAVPYIIKQSIKGVGWHASRSGQRGAYNGRYQDRRHHAQCGGHCKLTCTHVRESKPGRDKEVRRAPEPKDDHEGTNLERSRCVMAGEKAFDTLRCTFRSEPTNGEKDDHASKKRAEEHGRCPPPGV